VSAGTTVLLTTQYLEEADRLADRIAVVDHGVVIAEGTAASLKADLGSTVIVVTLNDAETADRVGRMLATIGTRPPHVDSSTVEITVEDGPRLTTEVLRALDRDGIPIAGLVLREPSLDDVFLSLTGHRAEPKDDDPENPESTDGAPPTGRRARNSRRAAGERTEVSA
jgi:ABC-type multidrug transport system ATPase subunit